MNIKCSCCNGTGLIAINKPQYPQDPPCLDCGGRKLKLAKGVGWYCESCESGPYVIGVNKLIRK